MASELYLAFMHPAIDGITDFEPPRARAEFPAEGDRGNFRAVRTIALITGRLRGF